MNVILGLGAIFLAGLVAARLTHKVKLPVVTAYLVMGIMIGPSVLSWIPPDLLTATRFISNIVLGMIAFDIGQNFSKDTFRRVGKTVIWISVFESCGAWLFVTVTFIFLLKLPAYISILFGAIAAATDPAATIMVIKEYRARGTMTDTLLGVVAVDDAWGLMIFAFSLALAKVIFAHNLVAGTLIKVIFSSLGHIFGAFALGAVMAMILSYCSKYLRSANEVMVFTLGFLFVNIGISIKLDLSFLLANMAMSAVLVNVNQNSTRFFESLRVIESPLYLLFFVVTGANLNIGMLSQIGVIGLVYLLVRVVGKVLGAYFGGQIASAPDNVKRYLGWGLVPQAGVALACALVAKHDFPEVGNMILTTIIATTVIYELIGPLCSKFALFRSGECSVEKIVKHS